MTDQKQLKKKGVRDSLICVAVGIVVFITGLQGLIWGYIGVPIGNHALHTFHGLERLYTLYPMAIAYVLIYFGWKNFISQRKE